MGNRFLIKDNTAFDIYRDEKSFHADQFFASNNLPSLWRRNKYKNESLITYGDPLCIQIAARVIAVLQWPLPYRSTMVFPIRFRDDAAQLETFYGFVCVDAPSKNAFHFRTAAHLGAVVADSICTLLEATSVHLPERDSIEVQYPENRVPT